MDYLIQQHRLLNPTEMLNASLYTSDISPSPKYTKNTIQVWWREFHKPPRTLSSQNIWTVSSESRHRFRGCIPEPAEELYFSCVTQKTTEVLESSNSVHAFQLVARNVLEDIMVTKANSILDMSSVEVSHSVA